MPNLTSSDSMRHLQAQATTLNADQNASASFTAPVLTIGVPKGPVGPVKLRYSAVHQTAADGTLTVTWPDGTFGASDTPVVSCDVQAAGSVPYSVLINSVSSSSMSCRVSKAAGLSLSILALGSVTLFTTPGITTVHVVAYVPYQVTP